MATITITGDNFANVLTGTSATDNYVIYGLGNNDTLTGNSGDDYLDGGTGNDIMSGGSGADVYIVDSVLDDVVEFGNGTVDRVEASVSWSLAPDIYVENLTLTGTANINATGNDLNNVLKGNSGNNDLNGGIGADTMEGGAGNDTYHVDNTGDVTTEAAGAGIDWVVSTVTRTLGANLEHLDLDGGVANINGTGNELANTIWGNDGNNVLDGKAGIDTMTGWLGDDQYYVDSTSDQAIEGAGAGIDKVFSRATDFTLGAHVENLELLNISIFGLPAGVNGTGNGLANVIDGSSVGNVLNGRAGNDTINGWGGHDTIDGGSGNDTMAGGTGNDTYIVDSALDTVTEYFGEGTDLVQASVTYTITDSEVDNLTLTGTGNISGNGNGTNNVITGNSGNNTLDGRTGADTMSGLGGNDTYFVDNAGDVVIEAAGGGTDAIFSSVTITLGSELENLFLTGAAAVNGTGNAAVNLIVGNSAANVLSGAGGNDTIIASGGADTLVGGTGSDTLYGGLDIDTLRAVDNVAFVDDLAEDRFVFDTTPNSVTNYDLIDIANFTQNGGEGTDDQFVLRNTVFGALLSTAGTNVGTLASNYFYEGRGDGSDAADPVGIYKSAGELFYNDSFGVAGSVKFAVIGGGVTGPVTSEEFSLA